MKNLIKHIAMSFLALAVLAGCSQGETLQSYYVAKQETPSFMSVDLPTSLVSIDETTLNADQKDAYNSLNKLNMLGFRLTEDNKAEYEAELAQVKTILKQEKYEELFRGSVAGEGRIVVKMVGEENAIDELIVFVSANDKGFAIIRVLGDNMEPFKVMQLGDVVKDVSSQENGVQDFMKFFN